MKYKNLWDCALRAPDADQVIRLPMWHNVRVKTVCILDAMTVARPP